MAKDTFFSTKTSLNVDGKIVTLNSPKVMGIVNTTPDSFFSDSRSQTQDHTLKTIESMIEDGVDMVDIGGYSSRPGAINIDIDEEKRRTAPVIEKVRKEFPDLIISIDTFRSEVARAAVQAGADIINDISGGGLDSKMFEAVKDLGKPYILMHMKGTPQTMAAESNYDDLILDMVKYFQQKVTLLKQMNVSDVILDLGFGFAKSIPQNYHLLKNLDYFKILELPLMVGLSRKSMIYKSLGITPKEALNGTTALHTIALKNGAKILRVHDVKEAKETVKLFNLIYNA